jgi:subtilisin family serine protease
VVLGADAVGTLPGKYLVGLKDGTLSRAGIAAQARRLVGDKVTTVFDAGFVGFSATLTAHSAQVLAADPAVKYVEQDRIVRLGAVQRDPVWGLDRIDERGSRRSRNYTPGSDARRVHAYVIDTGIRLSHRQFGGRAVSGRDFVDGGSANDCDGHGTHVAGTIGGSRYGVAKRIQLVAVRVLDCNGEGTISDVIAGINWVTANAIQPAVANMSLGGSYSPSLEQAVKASINSGITYVVAAGNEGTSACKGSPSGC